MLDLREIMPLRYLFVLSALCGSREGDHFSVSFSRKQKRKRENEGESQGVSTCTEIGNKELTSSMKEGGG